MLVDNTTISPLFEVEQTKTAEGIKNRMDKEGATSRLIDVTGFNKSNSQRITTFHLLIVSVYI